MLIAAPAAADEQFDRVIEKLLESRYETTEALEGVEHTRVLYGAYTTFSLLGTDDIAGNTRIQRQTDAKLWLQIEQAGHTFYGRLRFRYRDWNTGDSFNGIDDELVDPVGDRYWYKFDWRRHSKATRGENPETNFWVQVGRQYIHWASGIVLSTDLFAVAAGIDCGRLAIDGFYANSPSDMSDFDASRPAFNSDTDRTFHGVKLTLKCDSHAPYLFYVGQKDKNDLIFPGIVSPVTFNYDSVYIAFGSVGELTGALLYRVEIIHESGDSASDILAPVPQTFDDIDAWAGRIALILAPPSYRHTSRLRIEFEFLVGTGDDDRITSNQTVGGNAPGTDDEGFNAFGFANTGLVIAPELSNLISLRLSASLFPLHDHAMFSQLQVRIDLFFFTKLDDMAPVSIPTVPGGGTIGSEIDITIQWNVHSDVSIDFRYGIFIAGNAFPDNDTRHFVYIGISYGF